MRYHTKNDLLSANIHPDDVVLDIGFWGQGITSDKPDWPHRLILNKAKETYGIDLELGEEYKNNPHYAVASAEDFSFDTKFSVIFAGDLIEHLSNPRKFLDRCREHLLPGGRLLITTPNAFNLFNLSEKLTKYEPTVNSDHTFYFNTKTISVLLRKNAFIVESIGYVYTLGSLHKESYKKKFLNILYSVASRFTDKYMETMVIIATPV